MPLLAKAATLLTPPTTAKPVLQSPTDGLLATVLLEPQAATLPISSTTGTVLSVVLAQVGSLVLLLQLLLAVIQHQATTLTEQSVLSVIAVTLHT